MAEVERARAKNQAVPACSADTKMKIKLRRPVDVKDIVRYSEWEARSVERDRSLGNQQGHRRCADTATIRYPRVAESSFYTWLEVVVGSERRCRRCLPSGIGVRRPDAGDPQQVEVVISQPRPTLRIIHEHHVGAERMPFDRTERRKIRV